MKNVKDYGATGDGTTDDTTDFQAALDAAGAAGEPLFVPAGVYKVTNLAMKYSNTGLVGEGANSSIIESTATTDPVLKVEHPTSEISWIHIKELRIRGDSANPAEIGLYIGKTTKVDVDRCEISHVNTGIKIEDGHFTDISNVMVEALEAGGVGVLITGTSALETYLKHIFVNGNSTEASAPDYGFLVEDTQALIMEECTALFCGVGVKLAPNNTTGIIEHIWFRDCLIDQCFDEGLRINPASGETVRKVSWDGGWISSNGLQGVLVDGAGSVEAFSLLSCTVLQNGQEGIRLEIGGDSNLSNNKFIANSGSSSGTYDGILLGGGTTAVSGVIVQGNRVGPGAGAAVNPKNSVYITGTANNHILVLGNDLRGASNLAYKNDSAGNDIKQAHNLGV